MTQDEIIEMARQVGVNATGNEYWPFFIEELEAFTKLVEERTAAKEREACESIEYDLAKSPAMFATMAEYKAYKNGVQDYRTKIIARGEA